MIRHVSRRKLITTAAGFGAIGYVDLPVLAELPADDLTFVENTDPFDLYTYRLTNVLFSGSTAVQNVTIADTFNFGRALMIDGSIQSSADDEGLYHEALVQPALLRHPEPRDVLIIGGGEGAALRETLVHRSVRSVTMVDFDAELVELARQHLVAWHRGAFDDPRVRLVFADGRTFVEGDDGRYDVVIIDLVDLFDNSPAQALYTRQFYEMLRRRLRPNAVVAIQGLEFSFLDDKHHAALVRTLRTVFPEVHSYRTTIPSFLAGWGFVIASDWFRPAEWSASDIDRAIDSKLGLKWLDHLTGDFLKGCFSLCKETLLLLSQPGPIIEDGVAFVPPPDIEEFEPLFAQFPIKAEA